MPSAPFSLFRWGHQASGLAELRDGIGLDTLECLSRLARLDGVENLLRQRQASVE